MLASHFKITRKKTRSFPGLVLDQHFLFSFQIQISSLCMCVVLSATVTLCCLFMPKMYIVLFHPEKYARAAPGSKQPVKPTPSAGVSGLCSTLIQVQQSQSSARDKPPLTTRSSLFDPLDLFGTFDPFDPFDPFDSVQLLFALFQTQLVFFLHVPLRPLSLDQPYRY